MWLRRIVTISVSQRRALKMLADASTRGCAEQALRAQGFDEATLAELVNAGLVSRIPERRRAGGRSVDVAKLRIMAAGRGLVG
jgi:hypothetical protein